MTDKKQETERVDFRLSDGTPVNFDFTKMTWREYPDIVVAEKADESAKEDIIIRVCGMSREQFDALNFVDHWKLIKAFFVAAQGIMKNPNSQSASTSLSK